MEDWGHKVERILDKHRREDGSKWTGAALERATNGRVGAHFLSDLRRGQIQDPGIKKMRAISEVMGMSLEEWFEEEEYRNEGQS